MLKNFVLENGYNSNYKDLIEEFEFYVEKSNGNYLKTIQFLEQEFASFVKDMRFGGTRAAFIFENETVKFALSPNYILHNKKEIQALNCLGVLAPQVIDYDKNGFRWVVVETVNNDQQAILKRGRELFPNLRNFDAFDYTFDTNEPSELSYRVGSGVRGLRKRRDEIEDRGRQGRAFNRLNMAASEEGQEWLHDFMEGIQKCNIHTDDLYVFNWGVTKKTKRLVPLDLGRD